eukprot:scaffold93021_cov54-Phaeocystis_antarctica.AAC.2
MVTRSHSAGLLPAVLCRPRRVLADAALEELDAVRLEGEGVRADAVEEPAVVRYDERAASEVLQRLLERAQRLDVEIVGGLVEQQQVAALPQRLGEVHAPPLAAAEHVDLLLLRRTPQVERRDVRSHVDVAVPHAHGVGPLRDLLVDGLLRVEAFSRLADVSRLVRTKDGKLGLGLGSG